MRLVRLHRVLHLAQSHVLYRPPKFVKYATGLADSLLDSALLLSIIVFNA